jgi:hypothetical protein
VSVWWRGVRRARVVEVAGGRRSGSVVGWCTLRRRRRQLTRRCQPRPLPRPIPTRSWSYVDPPSPSPTQTPTWTPSGTRSNSPTPSGSLSPGASPSGTPSNSPVAAQPAGVASNVTLDDLFGWTLCHVSPYAVGVELADVLSSCTTGGSLMLACRRTGAPALSFAAWALHDDVLDDHGYGTPAPANGVWWWSFYYALAAAATAGPPPPALGSGCPSASDADTPMLCWRRYGGSLAPGGLCGGADAYYDHERLVLVAPVVGDGVYPDPSPARSATATRSATASPSASLSPGAAPSVTPSPSGAAYAPYGPQTAVPLSALTGWTPCFTGGFGSPFAVADVLAACGGPSLLMGCRPAGADTLTLAAWASRDDVTASTGNAADAVRDANGAGFYFGTASSWGFASGGDPVSRSPCDYSYYPNPDLRMCLEVYDGAVTGGYRCGSATYVYDDSTEAVWFTSDDPLPYGSPSSSATPTMTPSMTPTSSATATASSSPSGSQSPGASPSPSPTVSPVIFAPSGPQLNVPISSLVGWTQCFASGYDSSHAIASVLAACPGASLMMACRPAGSPTLQLLAWASRGDVTLDVGSGSGSSHVANGAQWYYS